MLSGQAVMVPIASQVYARTQVTVLPGVVVVQDGLCCVQSPCLPVLV